jgi:hypothetical protein
MCHHITKAGLPCQRKGKCPYHGDGLSKIPQNIIYGISNRVWGLAAGQRKGSTSRFNNFLNSTEGTEPIVSLKIARKPIESGVEKALNILSLGNFRKVKAKLGYDQVFHNYLIAKLRNGKEYVIQKNHVVEERLATKDDLKNEQYDVPLPSRHDYNLRDMVQTASMSDLGKKGDTQSERRFWQYDARRENCQDFTRQMLVDNGLSPSDPKGQELLKPQDAEKLVGSLGVLAGVPKAITTLASHSDRVWWGDGLKAQVDEAIRMMRRHHLRGHLRNI